MEKPYEKLKRQEEEFKQAKKLENYSEMFQLLLKIGELCYDINAIELGIKYIEEAFQLGSKQQNIFVHKHLFYKILGNLYFKQAMLNEALDAYKGSIKEMRNKDDIDTKAEIFFQIGRILILQDKSKAAIKNFKESEKLYESCENFAKQARVLNEIGVTYRNKTILDLRKSVGVQISDTERLGIGGYNILNDTLDSRAKKKFEKAFDILKRNNLLESEKKLSKTILSNLGIRG